MRLSKAKKEEILTNVLGKEIKIRDKMESLFTCGGTMSEDYIVYNNKKIGISNFNHIFVEYKNATH